MKKNLKIMVCGNFNVIHSGHIRILEFAKKLGGKLIVGVFDDKIAGKGAMISENHRLRGVKSLQIVNEAHLIKSKKNFILKHKPNILVKGKEYENQFNIEEKILKSYGGSLIFGSGELGISSKDLIENEFESNFDNNFNFPKDYLKRHNISFENLHKIVDKFNKLNILVIGDLIIDKYIFLDALGMSREDPTVVTKRINEKIFLGGAGIVAMHASALGAKVKLISTADTSNYRKFIENNLNKNKVNFKLFSDRSNRTVVKEKFRTIEKILLRINNYSNNYLSKSISTKIINEIKKQIKTMDAVIISDFNYGLLNTEIINVIQKYCKKYKKKIFVDCQSSSQFGDLLRYKNIDLVTPTEYEARINVRDFDSGLVVLSKKLMKKMSAKYVLLTLSKEGVLIQGSKKSNGLETDRISSLSNVAKDISGAGDSLFVATSLALSTGSNIWYSTLLGSLIASLQVNNIGNKPITKKKLQQLLKRFK